MTTPVPHSLGPSPHFSSSSTENQERRQSPPSSRDSISSNPEEPPNKKDYLSSFKESMRHFLIQTLHCVRTGINWALNRLNPSFGEEEASAPSSGPHSETSSFTPVEDSFPSLSLSEGEGAIIELIIQTVGRTPFYNLLSHRERLNALGESIEHVHPLKFLEFTFTHESLPQDLESIFKSPLKWRGFFRPFSEKMNEEFTELPRYLLGFSRAINVNLQEIQPFFRSKNWKGLIQFLIDVKRGRKESTFIEPAPPPTVAPSLYSVEDLPFSTEEIDLFKQLLEIYTTRRRWALLFDILRIKSLWYRLDQVHPLKLLASISSSEELRGEILKIIPWWGTNALFMSDLVKQLSRRPLEDVTPYLPSFAEICQLDLTQVTQWVEGGRWREIAEEVIRQENRPLS